MVLAEEAGVEAAGLGELSLGDRLVDAAVEVLTARRIRDRAVETEFHGSPLGALPDIRSIRAHSASVTGITDSRPMRTSGKSLKPGSALTSASVTGLGSRLTGATSTATVLSARIFGIRIGIGHRFDDA